MQRVQLSSETGATHSYAEEEKESFVNHINNTLEHDEQCQDKLPVDASSMELFEKCSDGILLCKLINDAIPETIDERVINIPTKNNFEMIENNNLCVNSAKAIGCSVINIGAQDILEGRPHLILGLIWQIVRIGLLSKITLTNHPELFRLLEPGEDIGDLLKLSPEEILLRWFNYHLKNAGTDKRVRNFSGDIKDSEGYTILLNQLDKKCDKAALSESDLTQRAEMVLQNADKLDPPCRKFVTAKDIVRGNPKLNLAFVANLFNNHPGLEPLTEEELAGLEEWLFASEGTREARAFCLWINSLGIEPFVNNLFEDLRNGLVLLRVMDKVNPGCVDWSKVNERNLNKFKEVENCNYAVNIGKEMKFSLVGIGGSDINDGNKTLTLALVWQLMRFHVVSILKKLSSSGKEITDQDMVDWANKTVREAGKDTSMSSFKDPSLRDARFFIDLLHAIKPRVVDYDLVTDGVSDEDALLNAKYAISVARKIGCTIFLLPEDIVEVKNKMILTFVGSIMATAMSL